MNPRRASVGERRARLHGRYTLSRDRTRAAQLAALERYNERQAAESQERKARFLAALERHMGCAVAAGREIGQNVKTYANWMVRDPVFRGEYVRICWKCRRLGLTRRSLPRAGWHW